MIKKLALSAVALSAVALIAACNQESGGAPDQQNQAANVVQDGTSGVVGAVAAPAGATTTEGFVTNAAIGGIYEVEAGRIAAQRSKTSAVKAFAEKMVAEHTAAGDELKPIAAALNVPAPTMLDERHKGLIDNLRGASDQDFDKVYLDQQEAAHNETSSLLENYGRMGSEATLKAWAAKTLP
ncbi:MAG: hypothetical protein JWR59_2252, partial [Brevundimonas sp.]|nr:hypothetical protein [Brevundimonas sp.]